MLVERVRRGVPRARHREKRDPPTVPPHDDGLLGHVAPVGGADKQHARPGELLHRLLDRRLTAVPCVIVRGTHDVEPRTRQRRRGGRRRGEYAEGIGHGVRVRRDRALQIAEGDIRTTQRVEERAERIQRVSLEQPLLCHAAPEVDVAHGVEPQRVRRPLQRRKSHVARRHAPRSKQQADHHSGNRPSTGDQPREHFGRVHEPRPRA